jgi:hypothetical protein
LPVRSWPKSTERLWGLSARLLAVASVLNSVGLGLAIRLVWRQTTENYGPSGTFGDVGLPFSQRVTFMMFDLSYRQVGVQLLLSSALVGAAVLALHRNASWARVRLVRWEVAGAGVLTLAVVAGLALANLHVLTSPDGGAGGVDAFMGPQPLIELILGSLMPLLASLVALAVATLWWLRLEPAPDGGAEYTDDTVDADRGDTDDDDNDHDDNDDHGPSAEQAAVGPAPSALATAGSENADDGVALGYPRDWSPEDFRRPS